MRKLIFSNVKSESVRSMMGQLAKKYWLIATVLFVIASFLTLLISMKFTRGTGKTLPETAASLEVVDSIQGDEVAEAAGSESVSLIFGGDVMLARGVGRAMLYQGFDPFVNVKATLQAADITVVNLECVISDKGYPTTGKPYTFEANPSVLSTLRDAGIDVVGLANNHVGDYGKVAFEDMLQRLTAAGLGYIGAGSNASEAYQAKLISLDGITVALLAVSNIETPYFAATDSSSGLAWLDEARTVSAIQAAQQQADFVVVMPHWGMEYTAQLHPEQERLAQVMITAGADLIVGSHPHHIQANTEIDGKKVFYSMGNFVFDGPGPNSGWYNGELVQVELTKSAVGVSLTSSQTIPYQIDNAGLVTLK